VKLLPDCLDIDCYELAVVDPGAIGGNCPTKCSVEWRPFDINAPLFGSYRSRNRDYNIGPLWTK